MERKPGDFESLTGVKIENPLKTWRVTTYDGSYDADACLFAENDGLVLALVAGVGGSPLFTPVDSTEDVHRLPVPQYLKSDLDGIAKAAEDYKRRLGVLFAHGYYNNFADVLRPDKDTVTHVGSSGVGFYMRVNRDSVPLMYATTPGFKAHDRPLYNTTGPLSDQDFAAYNAEVLVLPQKVVRFPKTVRQLAAKGVPNAGKLLLRLRDGGPFNAELDSRSLVAAAVYQLNRASAVELFTGVEVRIPRECPFDAVSVALVTLGAEWDCRLEETADESHFLLTLRVPSGRKL